MSYANMILYGSVLPSYGSSKSKDKKDSRVVNADDPNNKEMVRNIILNA